jgi:hypothetical protein
VRTQQDLVEQMRRFNNNTSRQYRHRVNSQLLAIAQVSAVPCEALRGGTLFTLFTLLTT